MGESTGETSEHRAPRPLEGLRVLVTRPRHQAAETCRLLEEQGAEVICMPTIEIVPLDAGQAALGAALREHASSQDGRFDHVVLTSANAVSALGRALASEEIDARVFSGTVVSAIGPGTAHALEGIGLGADLVPDDHRAEGLLALLDDRMEGARVLLPRAEVARELLPRELRARGARLEMIAVYRTVTAPIEQTRAGIEALRRGRVDVLTFTSASTARRFVEIVGGAAEAARMCAGRLVVAIGPVTRDACEASGLKVDLMPQESYTLAAMVDALCQHLGADERSSDDRETESI